MFYLLEAHGLDPWLVNARDVKHLPGRPKTDVLDAVWLCKVAERQMLRPSFVPPWPIRRLRDLTRYRIDLVGGAHGGEEPGRKASRRRLHQTLGRRLRHFRGLRAGDDGRVDRRRTRPEGARADGARRGCGPRSPDSRKRSTGTSMTTTDSCWPGCWAGSTRIDADIAALDDQIEAQLAPFAAAAARLDEIPGIGPVAAAVIIAEVGVDMSRFPTAGHLCSWAKFSPGINSSAGKTKGNGATGHGNRYLARILGEVAVVAGRTDTFLGERYRRIARRRGKKRAIVAVGRSILVIVWHLLSDDDTHLHDLGADHFSRHINPDAKKRNHIRQLEALGYTVTLTPAA